MTWTIYNNTTPFGLLDEDQKDAFRDQVNRLAFKYYNHERERWFNIWKTPQWSNRAIYQAVRAPVEETRTYRGWVRFYDDALPWLTSNPSSFHTDGTVTTTAVDGKPKRIVWEAD